MIDTMRSTTRRITALAGMLSVALTTGAPSMARADAGSTAAIIAGAAAIVGAIIYDSSNRPYYVRNERRYYITEDEAVWYRRHHRGYERRAYVPEQEYPVARDYDHRSDRRGDDNRDHGHQDNR
jgi:hypothetical protein